MFPEYLERNLERIEQSHMLVGLMTGIVVSGDNFPLSGDDQASLRHTP